MYSGCKKIVNVMHVALAQWLANQGQLLQLNWFH